MTKCAELANLIGNINAGGGGVNRNVIINGAMAIAQRGTSFTGVATSAYHLDRFRTGMGDTTARFTVTQASSGLDGFPNSFKYDCTTAEASLANGNARMFLHTRLEGQTLQHFKKGTSEAKPFVVSFYVKSNKTGTYILEIKDQDNTRQISKAYTINSANTWEQKSITFEGDTTGAFNNDNGESCRVVWHLIAGTSYTSGTLNTSWASTTNANTAVGNVNIGDSTDNTWEITGVQMEVGQNPTEFEREPFERTLAKCQRYFYKETYPDTPNRYGPFFCQYTPDYRFVHQWHPVTMRAVPTSTFVSNHSSTEFHSNNSVFKSYTSYSSSSDTSVYLTAYQADAEL